MESVDSIPTRFRHLPLKDQGGPISVFPNVPEVGQSHLRHPWRDGWAGVDRCESRGRFRLLRSVSRSGPLEGKDARPQTRRLDGYESPRLQPLGKLSQRVAKDG